MTAPSVIRFQGCHYADVHPIKLDHPFVINSTEVVPNSPTASATLKFLWWCAGLHEICQARLMGFHSRGQEIEPNRVLTLHQSDMCTVTAVKQPTDTMDRSQMELRVTEKQLTFRGGKVNVLSDFVLDEHWRKVLGERTLAIGDEVKAQQLPRPVVVRGAFTKIHDDALVSNAIYGLRITDHPHEYEKTLKDAIKKLRKGSNMPWHAPKMAIGTVFGREVQLVTPGGKT